MKYWYQNTIHLKGCLTKKEEIVVDILNYVDNKVDQRQLMKLNIKTLKIIQEISYELKFSYKVSSIKRLNDFLNYLNNK